MGRKGFTLIELSMVIIAIGLLVAGVFAGREMLGAANSNKVVTDFTAYKAATDRFRDKYQSFPGDLSDASRYWPSVAGNGNGDEKIDDDSENLLFWQDLNLARMINGEFTGTGDPAGFSHDHLGIVPGVNIPAGPFSGSAYDARYLAVDQYLYNGSHIDSLPNYNAIAYGMPYDPPDNYILSPLTGISMQEAYKIDKKMDDGKADAGVITGGSGHCAGMGGFNAGPDYDLTNTTEGCMLIFNLEYKKPVS